MKKVIFIMLLVCFGVTAQAKMYKCTDATGKLSFQDRPCATGTSQKEIKADRQFSARESTKAKEKMLSEDVKKQDSLDELHILAGSVDKSKTCIRGQLCWVKKKVPMAQVACFNQITSSFSSTDFIFYKNKKLIEFSHYKWIDKKHGVVEFHGTGLQMKNRGTPGWITTRFGCTYDLLRGFVIDVYI